jgi:hypothetical protein
LSFSTWSATAGRFIIGISWSKGMRGLKPMSAWKGDIPILELVELLAVNYTIKSIRAQSSYL